MCVRVRVCMRERGTEKGTERGRGGERERERERERDSYVYLGLLRQLIVAGASRKHPRVTS